MAGPPSRTVALGICAAYRSCDGAPGRDRRHLLNRAENNSADFKYYCPGIGMVLTEEGDVRVELIEYTGL
jgi:hypothetical protein